VVLNWDGVRRGGGKKRGTREVGDWVPPHVGWYGGEKSGRMDAGEVNIKERISMIRTEYFVLKEEMKYDECAWSNTLSTHKSNASSWW
jgi:hypothetical protein